MVTTAWKIWSDLTLVARASRSCVLSHLLHLHFESHLWFGQTLPPLEVLLVFGKLRPIYFVPRLPQIALFDIGINIFFVVLSNFVMNEIIVPVLVSLVGVIIGVIMLPLKL